MIITFATQKGGAGKTTLAIAFANYLASRDKKINVLDFDFQKSFYRKWEEDELSGENKLYNVSTVPTNEANPFSDFEKLTEMKKSEEIFLFDLAGTLDANYHDILIYSDVIIIPFEYSDVSCHSTLVFINVLGALDSEAYRIFVRSKYDKGYNYLNQEGMDEEISKYGKIIEAPVFKRNCLQNITTRKLTYDQKFAVKNTFNQIIEHIDEALQVTI